MRNVWPFRRHTEQNMPWMFWSEAVFWEVVSNWEKLTFVSLLSFSARLVPFLQCQGKILCILWNWSWCCTADFESNNIKRNKFNKHLSSKIASLANLLSQNALQGMQSILKFYRSQEILPYYLVYSWEINPLKCFR